MCVRYSTCADPRPTPRRTAGQGARPPATGSWALAIRRRISEGGVRWCEAGTERKEIGGQSREGEVSLQTSSHAPLLTPTRRSRRAGPSSERPLEKRPSNPHPSADAPWSFLLCLSVFCFQFCLLLRHFVLASSPLLVLPSSAWFEVMLLEK